ncbi:lysophospholipase [bacterium]|nr:lysophospholipase [bacterium]
MKVVESQVRIQGQPLHRLTLEPEVQARGGLVFFHGQGDFIDRYPPILEGFVKAGYRCILTDMPGHGRSPGRLGVVPGLSFTDDLLEESVSSLNGKLIITGHSVGGLMALRSFFKNPDIFDAAWISSPLLDPMRQARPWMKIALPLAAYILPWATVSTGVSSSDCGDNANGRGAEEEEILYHSRISIGWGRDLRDAADEVREQFPAIPTDKPALFTQGDSDPICPPEILEKRLKKLSANQITFEKINKALHEPFSGSTREEFLTRLNAWIDRELS